MSDVSGAPVSPIERRQIGQSELAVPPIALGAATFGWTLSPSASYELLDQFLELGGGLVDTASSYASGVSEQTIGSWMRERGSRDRIVVATKVGRSSEAPGLSARSIRDGVDASLRRLQTGHIDLLYFHAEDPDVPIGESLAAVDDLVRSGKVRALGASNFSIPTLLEARVASATGLPRIEAVAWEYSLLRRDIVEGDPTEFLSDQAISLMPYFVLAHGYLGRMRFVKSSEQSPDTRTRRAMAHANRRSQAVLKTLDSIALNYGTDVSTVALAWVLRQTRVAAAAVGADNPDQLAALAGANDIPLSRHELSELTRVSS